MSDRIKEVSHEKSDGAATTALGALVSGGLTLLMGPVPDEHKVVVEDKETGSLGVGRGASYKEATDEATRDLGRNNSKK